MAQKGVELDRESFSCSVCLDLLNDPVTLPCGHSYCMSCIQSHWDREDEQRVYSCPQCRQTFTPRPALLRNTMLEIILQQLKKSHLQAAPHPSSYAGPEDVACDVCSGRKLKALKSCLQCLASYCHEHLQPHRESPVFERHKLVDPSRRRGRAESMFTTRYSGSSRGVTMDQAEPKTRADFLKYSCGLTLDPNTANTHLLLSDGDRKATLTQQPQSYPSHPDRFTSYYPQVLSRERLSGRCYWEMKWEGRGARVAVSYKNISRSGDASYFGHNDKSWTLQCYNNRYTFIHNRFETLVPGPHSPRVGVYLDHRAGILSFYSVSETMTLIHRVQTTFTQPLHAGFRFWWNYGDSAKFIKLD